MPSFRRFVLPVVVLLAVPAAALVLLGLSQVSGASTALNPAKPVPATSLAAVIPNGRSATVVVLDAPTAIPLPEGRTAPVFSLVGLDGKLHRLTDYRGRRIVLNFWATWCVPCRVEMPLLQQTYEQLQKSDLVVVGINVAEEEPAVRQYVDDLHITFPILLDTDRVVTSQYKVVGLPTTYFIDTQGVIRASQVGPLTEDSLGGYLDHFSEDTPG
jgi:peroxiredoxin